MKLKKTIGQSKGATLAKSLLPAGASKSNTLVVIGNTLNDYPGARGYIRGPQRSIIEQLKKYSYVHMIDEYNTTKICGNFR